MKEIAKHPVLSIEKGEKVVFYFGGKVVEGEKGLTIAAALHRAGFPVHSHSLEKRNRSLECGIGKCGACEMLVDGEIRRICITPCDNVKNVSEVDASASAAVSFPQKGAERKIYRTQVAIIGAGPAGLAAREELRKKGIQTLTIDANDKQGGQFFDADACFLLFRERTSFWWSPWLRYCSRFNRRHE